MAWALLLFLKTLMRACYWLGCRKPSSMSSKRSHVTSFTANVGAIYSASVSDNATVACFFEHQLTGPSLNMKMKPKVDLKLFLLLAQSESEYPCTNSSF